MAFSWRLTRCERKRKESRMSRPLIIQAKGTSGEINGFKHEKMFFVQFRSSLLSGTAHTKTELTQGLIQPLRRSSCRSRPQLGHKSRGEICITKRDRAASGVSDEHHPRPMSFLKFNSRWIWNSLPHNFADYHQRHDAKTLKLFHSTPLFFFAFTQRKFLCFPLLFLLSIRTFLFPLHFVCFCCAFPLRLFSFDFNVSKINFSLGISFFCLV